MPASEKHVLDYDGLLYFKSKIYSDLKTINGAAITGGGNLSLVVANSAIAGATKCKITYDSKGLVTGGADLSASDIPTLDISKISGLQDVLSNYQALITSSNKLSSDLVDDTNATNKFVTASEKTDIANTKEKTTNITYAVSTGTTISGTTNLTTVKLNGKDLNNTNIKNGTGVGSLQQSSYIDGDDVLINGAIATGEGAVALGGARYDGPASNVTTAEGNQSLAVGGDTHAFGGFSVSLGKSNEAYQKCSVALGGGNVSGMSENDFNDFWYDENTQQPKHGGQGKDENGNVLDSEGETYANSYTLSFSVGEANIAKGRASISMGSSNQSLDGYAVTIGKGLISDYQQCSLGIYNESVGNAILMVGNGTSTTRKNALVVKRDGSIISGSFEGDVDYTTAYTYIEGYNNSNKYNSVSGGSYSHIEGVNNKDGSSAGMASNHVQGQQNTIQTYNTYCNHIQGFNNTIKTASYSFIGGRDNTINDVSLACVLGRNNTVSGKSNTVLGTKTTVNNASGDGYTISQGWNNTITGNYSIVVGSSNNVSSNLSSALGTGLVSEYNNQLVIGKYNDNKSTSLFEVGYGTANSRRNVFTVNSNKSITIGSTTITESQLQALYIRPSSGIPDSDLAEVYAKHSEFTVDGTTLILEWL